MVNPFVEKSGYTYVPIGLNIILQVSGFIKIYCYRKFFQKPEKSEINKRNQPKRRVHGRFSGNYNELERQATGLENWKAA